MTATSQVRDSAGRRAPRWTALAALALALLAGGRGAAQTNLETNAGVQYNFSTPGAGNLALGGAFLGLAFDASAAYTNPAGLTAIISPELVVEVRHWSYTHVFTDRGRIPGAPPRGVGVDQIAGLRDGTATDDVDGLSFVSYVHPFRGGAVALYRHELVNFSANFSTHGAYLVPTRGRSPLGIPGELDGRLAPLRNRMEVDIVAYAVAAAHRLGRGFSLGAAVSYNDFTIDSRAERFLPGFFDPPDFDNDPLDNFQTQQGADHDWSFAAGLFWEGRRRRWSAGGVVRLGSEFTFLARSQAVPPSDGDREPRFVPAESRATFRVPDVYGVGVAFRPRDSLRFACDVDRVRYSQLTDGFVDIFGLTTLFPGSDPELDRFAIDDADEIHLGMEYVFLRHWPVISVRAGLWYDPDHTLRFEGDNVAFGAVFQRRGDEMHYTAGIGMAVRRVQLDLAVDRSRRVSVVSLSAGYRILNR